MTSVDSYNCDNSNGSETALNPTVALPTTEEMIKVISDFQAEVEGIKVDPGFYGKYRDTFYKIDVAVCVFGVTVVLAGLVLFIVCLAKNNFKFAKLSLASSKGSLLLIIFPSLMSIKYIEHIRNKIEDKRDIVRSLKIIKNIYEKNDYNIETIKLYELVVSVLPRVVNHIKNHGFSSCDMECQALTDHIQNKDDLIFKISEEEPLKEGQNKPDIRSWSFTFTTPTAGRRLNVLHYKASNANVDMRIPDIV